MIVSYYFFHFLNFTLFKREIAKAKTAVNNAKITVAFAIIQLNTK